MKIAWVGLFFEYIFSIAKAIISSQLSKVVYKLPVENESEAAGCQLLEQYGIPAIFNPEIIVTEEHAEIEVKEWFLWTFLALYLLFLELYYLAG